ncbi:MAG: hypothetical protein AAFY64_04660 [Pseudomonadota bacterium]
MTLLAVMSATAISGVIGTTDAQAFSRGHDRGTTVTVPMKKTVMVRHVSYKTVTKMMKRTSLQRVTTMRPTTRLVRKTVKMPYTYTQRVLEFQNVVSHRKVRVPTTSHKMVATKVCTGHGRRSLFSRSHRSRHGHHVVHAAPSCKTVHRRVAVRGFRMETRQVVTRRGVWVPKTMTRTPTRTVFARETVMRPVTTLKRVTTMVPTKVRVPVVSHRKKTVTVMVRKRVAAPRVVRSHRKVRSHRVSHRRSRHH